MARLEPNGVPDPGADNLYVSDALVSFQFTVDQAEGDEFEVKNACGEPCISFKGDNQISRLNVTMQLCTPDPELTELLVGGTVLTDGDAVGYAFPDLATTPNPNGVSIELFAHRIDDAGVLDADHPYAWWVFPRVKLFIDSATFENGPFLPTFTGFATANEHWSDGPDNTWPVASTQVAQWIPSASIPESSCGYSAIAAT